MCAVPETVVPSKILENYIITLSIHPLDGVAIAHRGQVGRIKLRKCHILCRPNFLRSLVPWSHRRWWKFIYGQVIWIVPALFPSTYTDQPKSRVVTWWRVTSHD